MNDQRIVMWLIVFSGFLSNCYLLAGIPADVTPTYQAENNRFSVRYFLNLVLVDEEDRRYFKQQEIILWRKDLG
jgi:hypothetical protein